MARMGPNSRRESVSRISTMEVEMLQFRGKTARMKGMAYVDGQVVTEAEMLACVVDK